MSVVRRLPTMGGLGRKFLHKLPDLETLRNLESPFILWIQLDIYFLASTSYSQPFGLVNSAKSHTRTVHREAGEHRNCPVWQKGNATGGAAAAKFWTRRVRWVIGNPAAGCRVGDAASDPIRKRGTGVRSGRPIRDGWLVCAARRRSCRLSRAGMAVEASGWRRRGAVRQWVH